ncbi:hypothetical protein TSOC_004721 [Tetrabaena socialis]|uniref:Uncharacterized protein n=1 Tax=Tetrabaena socialis TaxID=47790 RepID=A0A2J8A825_9CHLO|nr:hypothetical protein TSOC_004721 [Tetrabaena socialis]|eukprot:PNH08686.1 hypothetical protein TSOC_004721 [Tetrabaena socialis]
MRRDARLSAPVSCLDPSTHSATSSTPPIATASAAANTLYGARQYVLPKYQQAVHCAATQHNEGTSQPEHEANRDNRPEPINHRNIRDPT